MKYQSWPLVKTNKRRTTEKPRIFINYLRCLSGCVFEENIFEYKINIFLNIQLNNLYIHIEVDEFLCYEIKKLGCNFINKHKSKSVFTFCSFLHILLTSCVGEYIFTMPILELFDFSFFFLLLHDSHVHPAIFERNYLFAESTIMLSSIFFVWISLLV